jgi:hypothetical protein
MQINLKQAEIEQALRAYVVAQGISLHGKDLTISFTAGRRESGISAEISIEDVEIPGYTNPTTETPMSLKGNVHNLAAVKAPEVEVPEAAAEPEAPVEAVDEAAAESAEVAVEPKPTVSLFG